MGNKDKGDIFTETVYLNPKYSFLDKHALVMYKGGWTPAKYEKLIKEQDVPCYFNETNEVDKEATKRCILAVATVEDKVKNFWCILFQDLPQTLIGDIGGLFGQSEVTHRRSYHSLLENLKIDLKEINEHEELAKRITYLNKHLQRDPKIIGKRHILKKLVLFTSLVERGSLFTQFYILMSFAKSNKGLKSIAALQRTTAQEEIVHYTFGIDLINIIKDECPQLWNDYLIELVEKNIKMAYDTELKLIDWFFEKGVPDHLTREEVVNFLKYNFSIISSDLGLELSFDYDEKMYEEKNHWMMEKVLAPINPDFFDNNVGGYSDNDEDVDIEDFDF